MEGKNRKILLASLGGAILLCLVVLIVLFTGGSRSGSDDSGEDHSQGLSILTGENSEPSAEVTAVTTSAAAETTTTDSSVTTSRSETTTKTVKTTTKKKTTTTAQAVRTYKFRSQKLLEQHFEKHGSEFGNITKEDYVRMANELINSKEETVLSKTEKEDGDMVFFDKKTGYFAVLSTDGYIRTFFIPDQGIKYYDKQ